MAEAKAKMKRRGVASPDAGDALACTFAVKVARADIASGRKTNSRGAVAGTDYNVFE